MDMGDERPMRRRAVLVAAASGAAAMAATMAAPAAALAADDDPVRIGQTNDGQNTTILNSSGTHAFQASAAGGDGLRGLGGSGNGSGVFGSTASATGYGVFGYNGPNMGRAALGGPDAAIWASQFAAPLALLAQGDSRFTGRVSLGRSGRATVKAGTSSVVVTVGSLSGTPLCFANLQRDRAGVWVRAVRPNYPSAGKLRIYLNKAVATDTVVAWVVLG
jgi:hypothetical protein